MPSRRVNNLKKWMAAPPQPVGPCETRTIGLPDPSPLTIHFDNRNWVYAQFGATGAIVIQQERAFGDADAAAMHIWRVLRAHD
ncbi:MAG: hypothetical protein ACPGQM_09800 [Alphaproteobacteria bacterium]